VVGWQRPTTCLLAGVVGPNRGHAKQAHHRAGIAAHSYRSPIRASVRVVKESSFGALANRRPA
jgi:hypothetical protein